VPLPADKTDSYSTGRLAALFGTNKTGAHRIQVNIVAHRLQVAIAAAIHDEGLVPAAEEVAEFLLSMIKSVGVNTQQPLHPRDQVGARRLEDQMKVVAHETPGVNLPVGFFTRLAQRFQQELAVDVVHKDSLTAVSAIHHVVHRAGILNSELTSHPDRGACAGKQY
jgi:hypothetical protein